MRINPSEVADLDRKHLWHPFTQQQGWTEENFPIIESADETTLYDTEGNAYIDGVSSLWCNVHGHRHPAIDIAIKDQLDRVAHSTMLGLSHAPAAKLAKRLVDLAPDGLTRVFFSDNGSTACEIALKMAYQWHHQRGEWWRAGFVCLRNSYHGDTLGSVSVGGIELQGFPVEARMGHRVTLEARARGAIIRPLGDTVVLMPPLSIEAAELRRLVEITAAAIGAAVGAADLVAAA